jgi:RNA polymerase sigma factor (sigma-70 family)
MPLSATQLAQLIENHAAALRLWAGSRCHAADDVVQEAFCRLAAENPPPANPAAWLYTVCRNLADKQRRSDERRRQREANRGPRAAMQHEGADPLELAEAAAAALQLDDELREVLIARIWGGLSLDEVARLCGISTATACRRYQAALEALRTKLESTCEKPG